MKPQRTRDKGKGLVKAFTGAPDSKGVFFRKELTNREEVRSLFKMGNPQGCNIKKICVSGSRDPEGPGELNSRLAKAG